MADNGYATCNWEEFLDTVRQLPEKDEVFRYKMEWAMAMGSGWDPEQFERLYKDYVRSTQVKLKPTDNATMVKGRPLEDVISYFLEKGGLINGIKPISDHGKWQVDGHGPVNKTAILFCWGEEKCQQIGIQVYMEAKNHTDPVENEEFSEHYRRMDEHHCNLGVMMSTSGYRIGRGLGIAESVFYNSVRNKFHILLVFQSLRAVVKENKPPLAILHQALLYAVNNSYVNDREVQNEYSENTCHDAARNEGLRLFGDS